MEFVAYGHPNIRATHRTTIEFTKDKDLSLKGDCIIGVNSDFDVNVLRNYIKKSKGKCVRIILSVDDIQQEVKAELNPDFNDKHEIVIRKSDFKSKRTLAIKADKAACDLERKFVKKLQNNKCKIIVKVI